MNYEAMQLDNNQQVFFTLVRAGLWEKSIQLSQIEKIDFTELYRLAVEQSIVGIVAAGIEYITDVKISQDIALTFAGKTLQLEQRNKGMNEFLANLIERMGEVGIYTIVVKGQGIAQCYEKPLWRTCGDIDLLLSKDNYKKALNFLCPLADTIEAENPITLHKGMIIDHWKVELHGTIRGELWRSIEKELDTIFDDIFYGGCVRLWMNGNTQIFLPRADEDVVYAFSHILKHFYKGGIGLRQICDWCRLLWKYRDTLDHDLLYNRLKAAGILTEWKAFAALVVCYLGMPVESMPMYSSASKWERKAAKIMTFILETGNFGHNRDMSFKQNPSILYRKWKMFCYISHDSIRLFFIFPFDSIKVWCLMMWIGFSGLFRRNINDEKGLS